MSGTLYIIATPIGNLDDFTFRAVEILNLVSVIAVEDTRKSSILLNKYNIKKPLVSNHKFNELNKVQFFVNKLLQGESIGLISDAGMPCISDPGYILVREAIKNDITVTCIPGATASITSVAISGFDTASFSFLGFLPRDKKDILDIFNKTTLDPMNNVFIFYESPKRILKTIQILCDNFSTFSLCLCNDLTKKFERIYRGSPLEVLNELNENKASDKGEYVLVINTNVVRDKNNNLETTSHDDISIEALLVDYLIKNKNETFKSAIKAINSKYKNFSKTEIYDASLNLKKLFSEQ